jgi:hypothetical protein
MWSKDFFRIHPLFPLSAFMGVPIKISVPVSIETKERINRIVEAHPITNPAAIARAAIEAGLAILETKYPPNLDQDTRLKSVRKPAVR